MLSNEPLPEPLVPRISGVVSAHAVDQMLRRALHVGPSALPDADEPDTWSAAPSPVGGFWGDGPRPNRRSRTRRALARRLRAPGRVRNFAAIVLVGALAAGWIATSQMGNARPRAGRGGAPAPTATQAPPPTPSRAATAQPRTRELLRAVVPAGATCGYGPSSANEAHCSLGGVQVDYRLLGHDALLAGYASAIGSQPRRAPAPGTGGAREPACARGGEEERSWSRPAAPRLTVGRYACRIEQGRPAIWWTVDDRGLLAHATSQGADLTSLFAWWESHSER